VTTTAKPPAAGRSNLSLSAADRVVGSVRSRGAGRPPRQLPVPGHLTVTSRDDLALEDAERTLRPPVAVNGQSRPCRPTTRRVTPTWEQLWPQPSV